MLFLNCSRDKSVDEEDATALFLALSRKVSAIRRAGPRSVFLKPGGIFQYMSRAKKYAFIDNPPENFALFHSGLYINYYHSTFPSKTPLHSGGIRGTSLHDQMKTGLTLEVRQDILSRQYLRNGFL